MPQIEFDGTKVDCNQAENLRAALMRAGLPLYNGIARQIHCRGLGTCGTCAIEITPAAGEESEGPGHDFVSPMTAVERWRLGFPPHQSDSRLRLACQCKVLADIKVKKHGGLWGHRIAAD